MDKPRILLVEDNPINQRVAQLMLQRLGYAIDIASNGQEAIDGFKKEPYDIILMDAQMPVMDGITASKWIRDNIDEEDQPKIFVMSATVTSEARLEWKEVRVDGYIEKPVRMDLLKSELENAVRAPEKSQ
jgi:CheY-like chemotaxis protein